VVNGRNHPWCSALGLDKNVQGSWSAILQWPEPHYLPGTQCPVQGSASLRLGNAVPSARPVSSLWLALQCPVPALLADLEGSAQCREALSASWLKIMAKTLESVVAGRLTRGSADRIKSISKGDGGKALKELHTRLSSKSAEIDGALKVYYNAAVAAGLSEPTTAALDTYVENVTMWNDSRGDTRKDSEAEISIHVVDAVRDLGDYIEGKLDIALHGE
jgi:hypothetical protein